MDTYSGADADLGPLMFSIASWMTRSVAEAEDLVEEGFIHPERLRQSAVRGSEDCRDCRLLQSDAGNVR
jgi:hypothetical protein